MKIKQIIKIIARKHNLLIIRLRHAKITGIDLIHDLSQLIKQREPVIFDVGANSGQSIQMFKSIWKNAVIYAFEPSSALYTHLKATFNSPKIILNCVALGSKCDSGMLNINQKSGLNSLLTLDKSEENRFRDKRVVAKETISINTVDRYMLQQKLQHLDLLKTDTQGFDLEVLKGAAAAFYEKRIDNILIEMNFLPMYLGQANPGEIFTYLSNANYNLVGLYEISRQENSIAWCNALFTLRADI